MSQFVQDNHSRSAQRRAARPALPDAAAAAGQAGARGAGRGVRRGGGHAARQSPTFGRWVGVELSGENQRQLWVPPGFAHGFLVLSESADFLYKTTDYYAPAAERCIRWNDPALGIEWPDIGMAPLVSAKDAQGLPFERAEVFP